MENLCSLCPNGCAVDRDGSVGGCGVNNKLKIAKYYLHPFEEDVINGTNGSGTVFFCGCALKCVFCQNYKLSRNLRGKEISVEELVGIFKELENAGAHNINLVNPTHYSHLICRALDIYKPKIPVVYNTHGYERLDVVERLRDYVDVWLPDMKFFSPAVSKRYTGKENYFAVASKAIEKMVETPLVFGNDGLMKKGVIVRHLVLPMGVADSKKILDWFKTIKDKAYINIMSQYTPFGDVENYPELKRKLTAREYERVIDYALSLGIEKAYFQKLDIADTEYIPKWDF